MSNSEDWDLQADDFDDQPDHGLADPVVRAAWRRVLLPLVSPAPARIADLGCGTGSLSVLLAQEGHRVSGLDFAPRMVDRARAKAEAAGIDATFVVGDASEPPWRPGSFDTVLTRHVLWALPDPQAAIGRWIDLLAPGGRLVLVEGRWWTGGGLASGHVADLVSRQRDEAEVMMLDDPTLWGGPLTDERYVLISRT